jgi:hypothetical protein
MPLFKAIAKLHSASSERARARALDALCDRLVNLALLACVAVVLSMYALATGHMAAG